VGETLAAAGGGALGGSVLGTLGMKGAPGKDSTCLNLQQFWLISSRSKKGSSSGESFRSLDQ
jgi:hypothetical protein